MCVQEGLMARRILDLRGREARALGGIVEVVEGVLVDLRGERPSELREVCRGGRKQTLAILTRTSERTRNLKRSSSVCTMINRKLIFGSRLPVCSSTTSICRRLSMMSAPMAQNFAAQYTCLRILSKTLSIKVSSHGRTSGAFFSFTQARVSSCRSCDS